MLRQRFSWLIIIGQRLGAGTRMAMHLTVEPMECYAQIQGKEPLIRHKYENLSHRIVSIAEAESAQM